MAYFAPLAIAALVLLLVLLVRSEVERRLVFKPGRVYGRTPASAGLAHEEVWLTAADGVRVLAWWLPRPAARGTLLLCHGNTGTMSERLWLAEDLRDLPVNVFCLDYRGYGSSGGRPSMRGIDRDLLAAHDWLRERHGGAASPPVVLWGRSLGAAIAARLAAARPPRGLILECTFTSIMEMGRRLHPYLLPSLLTRNRYDTLALMPALRCPVLIAHSKEDERIPYDMGESLFAAAPGPKRFVRLRGTHSEAGWRTTPEYRAAFDAFVLECLRGPPPG